MITKRVKLTFPQDKSRRYVFRNMEARFSAIKFILVGSHSDSNGNSGWMILDVEGVSSQIHEALDWAVHEGVRVDPAEEIFPHVLATTR